MRNLLTSYWRSLAHRPGFAALNIGGLALGIAVAIVLGLFVRFETGFDRWWPNSDQIYVVREKWTLPGVRSNNGVNTMAGLLEQMRGDFSGLLGTRIRTTDATLRDPSGTVMSEPIGLVDPEFFRVFEWPLAAGLTASALADPTSLVVNETVARRYFGTAAPLGRTIRLTVNGHSNDYRVTAVIRDLPPSSEFSRKDGIRLAMLARLKYVAADEPYWYHWGSESLYTFLRFPTPAAARAFESGLTAFVDRHSEKDSHGQSMVSILRQSLLPVPEMHLREAKDRNTVATLGLVGALALLIALVNYINLATARAGLRAREVAVRKALGATRATLARQFIGEAVITTALAALCGLALVEATLPVVNALGGTSLALKYGGTNGVLLPLAALVAIAGVLAGVYPALVLSSFQPAAVLASARTPGGGRSGARVREGLVIVQFAIATALTIGTLVLVAQTRFLERADLGFHRDGLILVESFNNPSITPQQRTAMLARFAAIPGVVGVTQSDSAPAYTDNTNTDSMARPGAREVQVTRTFADPNYFAVYGARLLAGRLFDARFGGDRTAPGINANVKDWSQNVIVNESAARELGFNSPASAIGGQVRSYDKPRTIIGVIADIRFRSPRDPVPPMVYYSNTTDFDPINAPLAALRFASADPRAITEQLRRVWSTAAPAAPFESVTARDSIASKYYEADRQRARLFITGAVLSVLIGAIGLYGLAAFNTGRRVREIGIRKTLGASTADVLRLLVTTFLRPVLLANLIAWPVAFVAMRVWLAGFDSHVALGPEYFLMAGVLAVLIAIITVVGQSLRLARAEPARALRYE